MNYPSSISARFNENIKTIKNNFTKYLLLNLWLIGIWLILFILVFIFLLIILSYTFWISFFTSSFNFYSLSFIITIVFSILVLFCVMRILKATFFIGNFYLTEKLDKKEKINLKELFIFSYKKLWDKALIDLWYFIIFLWIIVGYITSLIILSILIKNNFSMWNNILFIGLIILSSILFFFYFIKLYTIYYFADYYCFDTKNFSFKNFKQSTKLAKWKKLEVFGNILLIWVIVYIFTNFFNILFNGFHLSNLKFLADSSFWIMNGILIFSYIILIWLISFILKIFAFIYMYIYYKFLGNNANLDSKKDDSLVTES